MMETRRSDTVEKHKKSSKESTRVVIDTSAEKVRGTVSIDESVVASIAAYAVQDVGHDIKEVSRTVRQLIAQQVEKMAGKEVVEVNIHVIDIKLPYEVVETPNPRVT